MSGPALMKVIIIISLMIVIKGRFDREIIYDVAGPLHAEVGSSVIISCSYTHEPGWTPFWVRWFKCNETDVICKWSQVIFDSDNGNVQAEFKDRVSLLETNITHKNASIVIRDLRVSDTGSYQLIINGYLQDGTDWFTSFREKKPITVTGLIQPRIAGQTTVQEFGSLNLTCDAVSAPPSVVTWAKVGWTDTTNIHLVTRTQRADLFIPMVTREHYGRYSCTARNLTKTLTSFVEVTYIQKLPEQPEQPEQPDLPVAPPVIYGKTTLDVGGTLFLTCEAQSTSPSIVTWTEAGSDIPLATGTQKVNLFIPMVTREHSGRYSCTAHHLSSFADVTVIVCRCDCDEKEFFSFPAVVTSSSISMALICGLIVLYLISAWMNKTCHRCPKKTCQTQAVDMRADGLVEMVTQQTGGVCGVDGPEDGVLEEVAVGELPVPGTTEPCTPV